MPPSAILRRTLLLCAVLVASCAPARDAKGFAATVNGTQIRASTVEDELAEIDDNEDYRQQLERDTRIPVHGDSDGSFSGVFVARIVGVNVLDALVVQAIAERDLDVTDQAVELATVEVAREIGGSDLNFGEAVLADFSSDYRALLVDRAARLLTLQAGLADVPLVLDDATIDAFVDTNSELFDEVCTRHVLLETEGAAEAVRASIVGGTPLAEVAARQSLDLGTVADGGDRGCARSGQFAAAGQLAYESAAFALEIGEVSQPVQTVLGWHLLEVYRRVSPEPADVRGEGSAAIAEFVSETFDRWLETALATSDIAIDQRFGRWDTERLVVVPLGFDELGQEPLETP